MNRPAPIQDEAASAGFYDSPSGKHARLQLLTIEDLLTGKGIEPAPVQTSTAFKPAPQASPRIGKTAPFGFWQTRSRSAVLPMTSNNMNAKVQECPPCLATIVRQVSVVGGHVWLVCGRCSLRWTIRERRDESASPYRGFDRRRPTIG
jgi:hypothetical protein